MNEEADLNLRKKQINILEVGTLEVKVLTYG